MQRGFFLNIVIRKSTPIFELFTRKYETLLIRGDPFLVLNLCLDIVNGVGWFDFKCDGFSGQCFYESYMRSPRFRDGQTVSQGNSSWLDYHNSPTAVRSLREGRIHHHIELRPFTRGLPNPKRSYRERSHYLAY